MPLGAPKFPWTEDVEDEILSRLAGGESLTDICGPNRDDWLPTDRTVYRRLAEDDAFSRKYARAREIQAHREADEIRVIADMATAETVNAARLQVDVRKWRASKMAPKVYGDKLAVGGADDLPPVQVEAKMTDAELARAAAFILAKGVQTDG